MQHRCLKCAATVSLPDGQRFNVCPECGAVQAKVSAELQALDDQLAIPTQSAPTAPPPLPAPTFRSKPSGIALLAWAITLLCTLVAALYGATAVISATSAPQQAAAASIACAIVIVPYVLSRALDRMTQR